MITSRFWQLAAGVLLFQAMNLAGRRFDVADQPSPRWHTWGAMASIGLIAYSFAQSRPDRFPFPGALPAVAGAMGLLFFLHGKSRTNPIMRVLAARPVLFIGRISYSLYLWHWPVFVIFRWTIGLDRGSYRMGALAIAFVLSVLSYYFVEKPFRNLKSVRMVPRTAVVTTGFALIGMCAWFATQINAAQPRISLSTVVRHASDWYPDGGDTDPSYAGCPIRTETAPVGTSNAITFSRQNCGPATGAPRMYAIGDSHSTAYVGVYKEYVMRTVGEPAQADRGFIATACGRCAQRTGVGPVSDFMSAGHAMQRILFWPSTFLRQRPYQRIWSPPRISGIRSVREQCCGYCHTMTM
jgi:hypothetical protein